MEDDLHSCRCSVKGGRIENACVLDGDLVAERLEPRTQTGREVVNYRDVIAAVDEAANQVMPDEPGAACNESFQGDPCI